MNDYKEVQRGGILIITLIASFAIILFGFFYKGEAYDVPTASFLLVVASFILIYLLFSNMKTEVKDGEIEIKFGIGLFRKQIPLSDLSSVKVVRNKWYFGWGIRFFGKGWLWNYKGLDAVELHFKNKNSVFRIGSEKPEELESVITQRINSK